MKGKQKGKARAGRARRYQWQPIPGQQTWWDTAWGAQAQSCSSESNEVAVAHDSRSAVRGATAVPYTECRSRRDCGLLLSALAYFRTDPLVVLSTIFLFFALRRRHGPPPRLASTDAEVQTGCELLIGAGSATKIDKEMFTTPNGECYHERAYCPMLSKARHVVAKRACAYCLNVKHA